MSYRKGSYGGVHYYIQQMLEHYLDVFIKKECGMISLNEYVIRHDIFDASRLCSENGMNDDKIDKEIRTFTLGCLLPYLSLMGDYFTLFKLCKIDGVVYASIAYTNLLELYSDGLFIRQSHYRPLSSIDVGYKVIDREITSYSEALALAKDLKLRMYEAIVKFYNGLLQGESYVRGLESDKIEKYYLRLQSCKNKPDKALEKLIRLTERKLEIMKGEKS